MGWGKEVTAGEELSKWCLAINAAIIIFSYVFLFIYYYFCSGSCIPALKVIILNFNLFEEKKKSKENDRGSIPGGTFAIFHFSYKKGSKKIKDSKRRSLSLSIVP